MKQFFLKTVDAYYSVKYRNLVLVSVVVGLLFTSVFFLGIFTRGEVTFSDLLSNPDEAINFFGFFILLFLRDFFISQVIVAFTRFYSNIIKLAGVLLKEVSKPISSETISKRIENIVFALRPVSFVLAILAHVAYLMFIVFFIMYA